MFRHKKAWLLAALIAMSVTGCGTTGGKPTANKPVVDENSTDPAVAKAVALYKKDCLVCHGPQLEGSSMPNTNVQKVGSLLSKDQIQDKILKGGGGMIGYKGRLTEEDIRILTEWLATKK